MIGLKMGCCVSPRASKPKAICRLLCLRHCWFPNCLQCRSTTLLDMPVYDWRSNHSPCSRRRLSACCVDSECIHGLASSRSKVARLNPHDRQLSCFGEPRSTPVTVIMVMDSTLVMWCNMFQYDTMLYRYAVEPRNQVYCTMPSSNFRIDTFLSECAYTASRSVVDDARGGGNLNLCSESKRNLKVRACCVSSLETRRCQSHVPQALGEVRTFVAYTLMPMTFSAGRLRVI